MATGVISTSAVSADEKKTNYQAYAAELDKFAYYGDDLGANYTEKSTTFKVWSPKASAVSVDIYEKGSEEEGSKSIRSHKLTLDKKSGVWSVTISGNLLGVNPFNQPGVEAYKKNMFALLNKPGYEAESKIL